MIENAFPPIAESAEVPITGLSAFNLSQIYMLVTYISLCVLMWDYFCCLPEEIRLAWGKGRGDSIGSRGGTRWRPGVGVMKWCFLASRYLAIAQTFFVVIILTVGRTSAAACDAARVFPYGFTLVSFTTHFVMIFRIYGVYHQSIKVLLGLCALAVTDVAVQLFANSFVQPIFLPVSLDSLGVTIHACYLHPSSNLFALTFISPTIFHHIVLALTLYASWKHLREERILNFSVMQVLRRDQVFYVVTICLINFANVVLVLQHLRVGYRLVNFLPAMCLTQIFLGRIFFSLRSYLDNPDLACPDSPSSTTKRSRFGVKPRPSMVAELLPIQPSRKDSDLGAANFSMRSNSSLDNSFKWGPATRKASTVSAFGEPEDGRRDSTFLPKSTNALDDANFLEMMGFDRTSPAATPPAQRSPSQENRRASLPPISPSSRRPSFRDSAHRLANITMISPSTTDVRGDAATPSPTGSSPKDDDGSPWDRTLGKYRWGEEKGPTSSGTSSPKGGSKDRAALEGFPEDG